MQGATDERGRPLAAAATVFVSHAWGGLLAELVDALRAAPDGVEDAYFWVGPCAARPTVGLERNAASRTRA